MESGTLKETGLRIRCCKEHPRKQLEGYCKDYDTFFCRKCMIEHIGHEMENMKKFCERGREDVLDQISFEELVTQLGERRDKLVEEKKDSDKEQRDIGKKLTLNEKIIEEGKR